MPQAPERKRQPLDAIGLLLTSGALVAVLTGLDRVAAPGGTWAGAATLTVGVVLTTFAIRHIRRHPHPILPLAPLRDATFRLAGLIAGPLIRLSMRALPFLLPLMFQLELGMSALVAGAMLLALNGGDLVIKPVVATIIGRFGFRNALAAVGAIGCAAGLACVWFEAGFPVTLVIAILAVSGMSRSVLFTGLASLAYSEIAPEDMTAANVLMNITQQVTAALAVSLSALLLQSTAALRGAAEPGLTDFRIALVALVVLGAAGSLLLFRLGSATPVAPQPQPMDLELTDPDR
jgi:hypothetical protein